MFNLSDVDFEQLSNVVLRNIPKRGVAQIHLLSQIKQYLTDIYGLKEQSDFLRLNLALEILSIIEDAEIVQIDKNRSRPGLTIYKCTEAS